jgi:hypothetical protein
MNGKQYCICICSAESFEISLCELVYIIYRLHINLARYLTNAVCQHRRMITTHMNYIIIILLISIP